ncbi:MAG: gamma-glutamyl-gamma-aminobutyrate hydrolase family protein [Tepidiformaceae bacterium]
MGAPLIAVTTSIAAATPRAPERAQLNASYLHAVQRAGGVPIMVPPFLSPEALAAILAVARGLILTGGGDVSPALYGEEPHPATAGASDARDSVELECIRHAIETGMPVLAICRGMQVLNVAFGGSLVQDIPTALPEALPHGQAEAREVPTHEVVAAPGSRLAGVLGAATLSVNSLHHQSVRDIGKGLEVVARAPDGVIEAMEMPAREAFLLAVQWHPEELAPHSAPARHLFAALVAAARPL